MTRLLLIRHCETTDQAPEAPLTDAGLRAADVLADALEGLGVDLIVSSPYRRALQTVEPLAARTGLAVQKDARLRERLLSEAPLDDWRDHIARSFADLDYCVPSGESGRAAQERGWAALDEVLGSDAALPAVASHGGLIALMLKRLDAGIGVPFWERLGNPDVFELNRHADTGSWTFERRS